MVTTARMFVMMLTVAVSVLAMAVFVITDVGMLVILICIRMFSIIFVRIIIMNIDFRAIFQPSR